jgi:hypothetical protein
MGQCLKGKNCRRAKNGSPGFPKVSDKEGDFKCIYYLYVIKVCLRRAIFHSPKIQVMVLREQSLTFPFNLLVTLHQVFHPP